MTDFESRYEDELAQVPDEHFDRDRFVPAGGRTDADVMLVGEAPGAQEVERGEPFVGQAGGLLNRALSDLDVDREDVYVTNVVKTRPPENRSPHVAEVEAWKPVLDAEIEAVDPAVVVALGNTAARTLLETDRGITDLRGDAVEVDGRTVLPTFHPAALFYDSSKREAFEADLRRAFEAAR